jgi:hypothetical protein
MAGPGGLVPGSDRADGQVPRPSARPLSGRSGVGVRHGVTSQPPHKNRDEWKTTDSFVRDDLPLVAMVGAPQTRQGKNR